MARATGKCYHIKHPPSANSGSNKYTIKNNEELGRVRGMSRQDLVEYIKTWEWLKK